MPSSRNGPRAALLVATCATFLATALVSAAATQRLTYPTTRTGNAHDTYYGHVVSDPYRWLENASDPAVKAWAAAQTKLAISYLKRQPTYEDYKRRVALLSKTSTVRFGLVIRGGRYFYLRETPPQAQAQLVVRDGLQGAERVLFDPQSMAHGGAPPAIETYRPALDGSKVAFTSQPGGSENETLHFVDASTGTMLPDEIPHVGGGTSPTALAWDSDAKGLIHTLFPKNADGSYSTAGIVLMHHVLGTDPSTDTYVFGKGLSPRAEYALTSSLDGKDVAAFETDGDGVHASGYLRHGNGEFALVVTPDDAIGSSGELDAGFVGNSLYVISKKRDSRGEVVAIAPGQTFATGKVVVPASNVVIQDVREVAGGFLTIDVDGGDSSARLFAADGTLRSTLPIPPISVVTAAASDPQSGAVIIGYENYTTPDKWLSYDSAKNTLTPTGIAVTSPADFSHVVADRVFVPSLDGKAKIPLEIVHAQNIKMDGTAPTILTAYGAYGVISTPFFDPSILAWIERGGVFAQAMIRGGGEYGDAWHMAARHETKTVSSDDVAACASWLGAHGYGNNRHIGIVGGSAGGFLMGLALTRNPQLYRAVVSEVGIYDLLRVELTPNGAYNTPEFGTVKDPAQFQWMLKQSPYHNAIKGHPYPAVLMTTGENDPRVDPYMSRKMIARLQADASSVYPILLIQRSGEGHGIGNSFDQDVEQRTQTYVFFDSQLH
jgi:prolyl oligopeptidase